MQRIPIFLSLAIADLYLSYTLFTGQQYFSFLASVGLFVLFVFFALLFVLVRIRIDDSKKAAKVPVAIETLAILSIFLIMYELLFVNAGNTNLASMMTKLLIVVAAVLVSACGIYLIGKINEDRKGVAFFGIAAAGLLLLTIIVYLIIIYTKVSTGASDELAFNYYSSQLLLGGHNPYVESMAPALTKYYNASKTYWLNGSAVDSYDYPAFSFISIAMLALFFGNGAISFLYGVSIFLCLLSATILYYLSKRNRFALLPIGVWLIMTFFVVGSVIEYLAVSVLMLLAYIYMKRPELSGLLTGLAISTAQLAWFIAPFFYVFVYRIHGRGAFLRVLGVSLLVFILSNGYFLLSSPGSLLKGLAGTYASVTISGPSLVQILIHAYPVPYTYSIFVSAIVFLLLIKLFYLYPNSLRPLLGIAPLLLLFLSWRNSVGYALPVLPFLLAVSYYSSETKKAKDMHSYKKHIIYACVALLAIFATALVYSHNYYTKTDILQISSVVPGRLDYAQNGVVFLRSLNVRMYNSGNSPARVFFEEYARDPPLSATLTGSMSNSTIPAMSYMNFTLPCPLAGLSNSTRIFIIAYSNTSIATIKLAAS